VIGEIKGSEFPNEYITVGGHLDSWDVCEGAHDDGAGCVQTIEILRAFKALGYKPKRSIRFVLFANEENGLRGGTKYAEEAKAKGEKHVFAVESDAGGFTPRGFGFNVSPAQFQKVVAWQSLLAPYGATELTQGGGGADIGPLNRNLGTPVAGLQPDSQRYFDYHHARNDVFEAVNKRELELGAVNMAALIYLVDKYGL
jgi:acetylornithine deacetylase/succinyl-diaminopimelate desuccinylase-like protein